MIKGIFCWFFLQFLFYFGYSQKDTAIFKARLIDTVTEHTIEYLPDHIALSVLFTDSIGNVFAIAFYEPDTLDKGIFQLNRIYNIYGHKEERYVFQPASKLSSKYAPLLLCDSIIIAK
jgi:hypothetical protein